MWQSASIWERHKQMKILCMKKLRAGNIQGMAATIQPTFFWFSRLFTKYILSYLLTYYMEQSPS